MALTKSGADRQKMHERLRVHSLAAWKAIQAEQPNPLADLVAADPEFLEFLPAEQLRALMDSKGYVGFAPQRALAFAETIIDTLNT